MMVPYEQLSEPAKNLDRGTVRAVCAAIRDAGAGGNGWGEREWGTQAPFVGCLGDGR